MAIDLSTYHIVPGDDTELPTKLNDMMDAVEAGVNGGLSDIDDNLDTLSAQITSELGDAVDTVEAAGVTAVNAAATATTQAGIATTGANNATTQAGFAAESAATAAEISNIDQVQTFTNPLARAVRVAMTGASSGSRGWLVQDNPEVNFGVGDFTLHWEGSLGANSLSSTFSQRLLGKYVSADDRYQLSYTPSLSQFDLLIRQTAATSVTVAIPYSASLLNTGEMYKFTCVVVRETASTAGSVTLYINGVQAGSGAIPSGTPASASNSGTFQISGNPISADSRIHSNTAAALTYNRALSSTEVLDLAINGPSPADMGTPGNRASQVPVYESDFSAGTDGWSAGGNVTITGNNDGIGGEDDWLEAEKTTAAGVLTTDTPTVLAANSENRLLFKVFNPVGSGITHIGIGGVGSAGVVAVPEGSSDTLAIEYIPTVSFATLAARNSSGTAVSVSVGSKFYIKDVTSKRVGITGLWSAEHAQSDTGQVFDQINGNHALLPSSGATRIPQNMRPVIESPSAHSWAATNEIQYVAGNQALMSSDDSFLVIDIDSDTAFSIDVGDGADQDRFVAAYALSVGKNRLTIANPFNDGTNRKLTVKPTASVTAEINVHAEMIKERI